jgi:hypothetical protein
MIVVSCIRNKESGSRNSRILQSAAHVSLFIITLYQALFNPITLSYEIYNSNTTLQLCS